MIRKNAAEFKPDITEFSSSAQFDEFMETFNPELEQCPGCGAIGECRVFAYYDRLIVDIKDGHALDATLRICRVKCSCGCTHAVLPDFIIPYRSYSLAFILHVLRIYFSHSMTVASICSSFGLSYATLYRWKAIFVRHKFLWLERVIADKIPALAFLSSLLEERPFSVFSSGFFKKTLFSFMQSHANPANCCRAIPGWPFSAQPTT